MSDLAPQVIGLVRSGLGWRLWSREDDRLSEPAVVYDLRKHDGIVSLALAWREADLALEPLLDRGRFDETTAAAMRKRGEALKALRAAIDEVSHD